MTSRDRLDEDAVTAGLTALDDGWLGDTDSLRRSIEFADFLTAVDFIVAIAPHCEELDHHPDLELHWRRVDLELSTHSSGGVTALDLRLAAIVDEVCSALPLAPHPAEPE
jgi:4a-hydroxytetrahydrobiopterin dehydratase